MDDKYTLDVKYYNETMSATILLTLTLTFRPGHGRYILQEINELK